MRQFILRTIVTAGLVAGGVSLLEAGPYDWRPGYDSFNSWRGNSYDNYPNNRNGYSYQAPSRYVTPYYNRGYVPYGTYYGPTIGYTPYYYQPQPYFRYQYNYQYWYGY